MKSPLLIIDAIIDLLLGIPLIFIPHDTTSVLGLPVPASGFYPTILGAVLTGIGIALLIQVMNPNSAMTGLGLEGALCINLSGSAVLLFWLLSGSVEIPARGRYLLWTVALLVIFVSILEFGHILKKGRSHSPS